MPGCKAKPSTTTCSSTCTTVPTVPERRFVRFLLERRFVYRTPSGCVLPYAKSANDGLFCVRDYYRNGHTGPYTLVTPKGKLHFAGLRDLILVTV